MGVHMRTFSLSENRAKKLIEAWEGHIENGTDCAECKRPKAKCLINSYFKQLKRKIE